MVTREQFGSKIKHIREKNTLPFVKLPYKAIFHQPTYRKLKTVTKTFQKLTHFTVLPKDLEFLKMKYYILQA
ncbi:hypothetical protein GCM10025879_14600 [Leuconostoc litchii]|nr:hypothetical protein GCM10025879_14600 [Leuconostoc litchii]